MIATCARPRCGGPHRARGLCRRHYLKAWRTGAFTSGGLVEATPIRRHVHRLLAAGWTLRGIARATDTTARLVSSIADGQRRVQADTARKLRSLPADTSPPAGS